VLGLDYSPGPLADAAVSCALPGVDGLLAYAGLGPGQEFLPYFLAMLGWAGAALVAILHRPITAALRVWRTGKATAPAEEPPHPDKNVEVTK